MPTVNASKGDLAAAVTGLLDGYRAAKVRSGDLDALNRALVSHVIATSSAHSAQLLATRTADTIAGEVAKYAAAARAEDSLGKGTSAARHEVWSRLKPFILAGGAIGAVIAAIAKVIGWFSDAGGASQSAGATVGAVIVLAGGGAIALVLRGLLHAASQAAGALDEFKRTVSDTFHAAESSTRLLAETVDQPEVRLATLLHARPARRLLLQSVGPLGTALLLLATAFLAYIVLRAAVGFFGGP